MKRKFVDKPIAVNSLLTFQNGKWIAQKKLDGYRCIVEINGDIKFWSRNFSELKVSKEIQDQIRSLNLDNTMLDGEWLKQRTDYKGPELLHLFGVLYLNGEWVGPWPEEKRWEFIQSLNIDGPIKRPDFVTKDYQKFFETSKSDKSCEGIVLKAIDAKLVGDRNKSAKNPKWFKKRWRGGFDGQSTVNY